MEKKFDSNEQYHSHDSISASGLKFISEYPIEKFLTKVNVTTPAMALGSATHEAVYQPQVFYKNYYPNNHPSIVCLIFFVFHNFSFQYLTFQTKFYSKKNAS